MESRKLPSQGMDLVLVLDSLLETHGIPHFLHIPKMHGLPSAADIWDLCARGRLCSRRPLWLEAKGVLAIWPLLWQLQG